MENLADGRNIHREHEQQLNEYGDRLRDLCRGTAVLWSSGYTFRNACDIMVLYLSGLLPSSPTHLGPSLGETSELQELLQQTCRNGILATSSEPAQHTRNIYSGELIEVKSASIEVWIKTKDKVAFLSYLQGYEDIHVKELKFMFSEEFGPSYEGEDMYTTALYIVDDRGDRLFKLLANCHL